MILFTKEIFFIIEQKFNTENERIWYRELQTSSAIFSQFQIPESVIVRAGTCLTGKSPLLFIEKELEINRNVYLKEI